MFELKADVTLKGVGMTEIVDTPIVLSVVEGNQAIIDVDVPIVEKNGLLIVVSKRYPLLVPELIVDCTLIVASDPPNPRPLIVRLSGE